MKNASNVMAILGAIAVVVGISMFKLAAGVIALGVVLILGAVATMREATPPAAPGKKAVQP